MKESSKAYYKGFIAVLIAIIICDSIYLIAPTIMYRPPIPNYDPFTNLVLKITYYFDEPPLNCFPSLHCIFCFQVMFSYIISKCTLKRKTLITICSILIVLSTLFVKQHYIFDVIAAFIVCLMANMIESMFGIFDKLRKKKIL